jgi:hypothetical protein
VASGTVVATLKKPLGHDLPSGFQLRENFITPDDELDLINAIAGVAFANFEFRGVVARRRVAFFGESYDRDTAVPLPGFLLPLRAPLASWAGVDFDAFAMALVNEYRPKPSDRRATMRLSTTSLLASRSCPHAG